MAHDLLLNPFSLNQEPAQIARRRAARATRSTPVCSHCRSDDIISQATAQWSNESQEWELAEIFDQPTSSGCPSTKPAPASGDLWSVGWLFAKPHHLAA